MGQHKQQKKLTAAYLETQRKKPTALATPKKIVFDTETAGLNDTPQSSSFHGINLHKGHNTDHKGGKYPYGKKALTDIGFKQRVTIGDTVIERKLNVPGNNMNF